MACLAALRETVLLRSAGRAGQFGGGPLDRFPGILEDLADFRDLLVRELEVNPLDVYAVEAPLALANVANSVESILGMLPI